MKRGFWGKKVPGFIGLIFIIISLVATVYLVREGVIYLTGATPSEIPKDIKVTNVTDSSFSVSYSTSGEVSGSLNFGKNDDSEETVLDQRDQLEGSLKQYNSHIITPGNLDPSQKYKYSILSGSERIVNDGVLFEVQTGPAIDEPPSSQKPIVGKVTTDDGAPSSDTLIYFSAEGAQELSTVTKEDGTYILPLNSLRNETLTEYFELKKEDVLKLFITDGEDSSKVLLTIEQIDPVPTVIISNDYDFRIDLKPVDPGNEPEENFPKKEETTPQDPQINSPSDRQTFTDQKPEFSGSAQPNAEVEIEIHSEENIKTRVVADSSGNWEFRPEESLSPGEHTITIKTKDSTGVLKTITRNFTVFAAGTQVDESATPSGKTISPTPTPTLTPTSTPIPAEISPKATATPVLQPTIPPTGGEAGIIASFLALGITIFGAIVFLITRNKIPL